MFSIYIWLKIHEIIINCTQAGCVQTSMSHFNYLMGIGALELIFELSGIIKIFSKKGNNK